MKAIEKVTDTQLALLLLRQVNNNSLTYTLRTSHSLSTNKGHCYRVNKRCAHWSFTVAVWLLVIEKLFMSMMQHKNK